MQILLWKGLEGALRLDTLKAASARTHHLQ